MVLWWTVVSPAEAHLVVYSNGRFVACPDETIGGRKAYFAFPEGLPWIGRRIRVIPLTIQEINVELLTYEKGQARFMAATSAKYKVVNVKKAAETIITMDVLKGQLVEIIKAATTAVSSTYDVTEIRSKKEEIQEKIINQIIDDFAAWGLELVNFQVSDITDTPDSHVVSNISKRREVEIESTTREQNANNVRMARMKEAEADEAAKTREIARDKVIAEKEQNKQQAISEQRKIAQQKEYEVLQVQTIKQAEIDKEKAAVDAEKAKQVAVIKAEEQRTVTEINKQMAEINKDKLFLEGEGERLKKEQIAIGEAAKVKQDLLAQAEGKEALQKVLSLYDDKAIRALTAEQMVNMQRDVGIATANALQKADVRLFAGTSEGKTGFELGQFFTSVGISNDKALDALINRLSRPNDLGLNRLVSSTEKTE